MAQLAVNDDLPANTGELLHRVAARYADRIALRRSGVELSYAALERLANRFAHAVSAGQPSGSRVAIMAGNGIGYAVAHFGTASSGRVLAHLSSRYSAEELLGLLERLTPHLLLLDRTTRSTYDAVLDRLALPPAVVMIDDGGLDEFVAGYPDTPPAIPSAATDPFCIQFTGGTTGTPKGVVINHRARLVSSAAAIEDYPLSATDTVAVTVPLCHAAGLFSWFQPAIMAGTTAVFLDRWSPDGLTTAVERDGVNAAFMVPTQVAQLLDTPGFSTARLAGLSLICCGGAPASPELLQRAARMLPGTRLVIAYGSTETGHLLSCPPEGRAERAGALGRPGPRVAITILKAPGVQAASGEVGEITTTGDHLMDGYLDNPDEDAAYFRSGERRGWTGDLGRFDADGLVVMAGRRKEMILTGGLNLFPSEIELVLERHPGIAECVVFGIPDPRWGELPAAAVVARPGVVLDPDELMAFTATGLARHKRLRFVAVVDALPRTAAGKPRRNVLAERYRDALTAPATTPTADRSAEVDP